MPSFPSNLMLSSNNTKYARPRIVDVPLSVPICIGCEWILLDVSRLRKDKILNRDNHLRGFLDFSRSPWNIEVER